MSNLLDSIPQILLMGPGPSCVHPSVYAALAKPTLGHLDPYFIQIMDEIKSMQQRLMHTRNEVTFPVSGTGSAGMEAVFVNLLERGERVLVLVNGVFGKRMVDVAQRLGGEVDALEFPWGTPVLVDEVAKKLREKSYALVAVVHAETSTGVRNPVQEIGALVKPTGALYIVDAVTSLGGIPVLVDDWNIDALYSGTQKCLSCPPGLSPVTMSVRAIEKLKARKTKVPNWYLDLSMIVSYWEGAKRAYHHTAPINMLYGLYQTLKVILEEGEEATYARHLAAHEQFVAGLKNLGLDLLVHPEYRLPMLNAVKVPEGVDEAGVRKILLDKHRIEIGAGLGPLAGKIWRVGLMGHTAWPENVDYLLGAFKDALGK